LAQGTDEAGTQISRAGAGENAAGAGLIVELVEQDNVGYHGAFYFDMMETLLKRLVLGLANDLGKSGITAVAVAPGLMRTEAILDGFGVTEANWRDALGNPQAVAMGWGGSEPPCFVGRAVAALADPRCVPDAVTTERHHGRSGAKRSRCAMRHAAGGTDRRSDDTVCLMLQ
jgi:NAD(P)-dependent dehydrogenase (short-subunit alcohol dehydrogenase family)